MSAAARRAPRRAVLAGAALLLAVTAVAVQAGAASAHAELVSSTPAANASLKEAPTEVVLVFSEPVDPATASLQLLDENERRIAGVGALRADAAGTTARASLPTLAPGVYTVSYRVTSAADGHVTSGLFAFLYDPTGTQPAPSGSASSSSPSTDPGTVAARWATLVLLLLLFGTAFFWLVSARPAIATTHAADPDEVAVFGGATIWGVLALLAFAAFLALAIFLTLAAAAIGSGSGGGGIPLDFAAPFGWTPFAVAMRVALAGTGFTFALMTGRYFTTDEARRRGRSFGMRDGLVLGIGLVSTGVALAGFSLAGHAAARGGIAFAAVDWLHLLGVAGWLGTLGGLALLAWRTTRVACDRRAVIGAALARHSRIALVAAPAVALTGLANSPLVLGQARDVVASDYGNLVFAKVALFSMAVAIGAVNFFLVRRRSLRQTALLVAGEGVIGLVAAVAAATMLTIQPAASRLPVLSQSAIQTSHLYGTAGDSTVHAVVAVPAPGEQLYQVAVADKASGATRTDVQKVFMEFTPPGGSTLPGERIELTQTPETRIWATEGTYTPVVGDWTVQVIVRRVGQLDEKVSFPLTVAKPLPPELVPPPDTGVNVPAPLAVLWFLPDGPAGWLLVCLLLAVALGLGLVERSRRRSERASRRIAIARLAVVAIAVVCALGVGSRAVVQAANRATSAAANPIPAAGDSIGRGQLIYLANCSSCHGADGGGDGPQAAGVLPAPAPLAPIVPHLDDSTLHSEITNGIAGTNMPSFASRLSENDRWDLVNYLHSLWPPE